MKKKYILPTLLILQIVLLQILKSYPEVTERYYSNGLYQWIAAISRTVFGKVPFSIGDIIYFILVITLLRWLYKNRKTWRINWKDNLLKIVSIFSVTYFLFHLLWAINYYRVPLYKKMAIERKYSEEQLITFTKKLINKTNEIHHQIVSNDSVKVTFPYTEQQIFDKNIDGYKNLSSQYPFFSYEHPSIKKSLISTPLTYMGFSGYLNPFTGEAQVNDRVPLYNFPTTACHEMAHQIGYASESEANFIGYLASIKNNDMYFKFSGYSFALKHCLNVLEKMEEGKSKTLLPLINKGIRKNFKESHEFWESHQTFIEPGFKFFYDNFLKFNSQKDGLESYSKFVDLMVNYYKYKPL